MKRIVSTLLTVCICLCAAVMLTSCGHEHTYKTEWSKDATHHWHDCEGKDCAEVSEKAEHTWNGGEITTSATPEADGVKTFTCTACGQTKTEAVSYAPDTTVTEAEWLAAFSRENFMKDGILNLTVIMDTSWDGETTALFADGKKKEGSEIEDGWDWDRFDSSDYYVLDFADAYAIFEYDSENGVYVGNDGPDEVFEIAFLDKKLVYCKITLGSGEDADVWTTYYTAAGETVISEN